MIPTHQVNMQRARLLFQQGRFDMAADALRAALGEAPEDAHAHSLLGLCYAEQEKYEEAGAEAELGIFHAPDSGFAHYAMGYIFHERNRFAEAEAAAREAVRVEPEDADYWGLLSQTLMSQRRWREALDAAAQGLQADPEHTACNNLRAMAMVQLGDKAAASQSIAETLRRNPHSASTHASQGWAMLHQSNSKQALEHFREALRLDPTNQWARQGTIEALRAKHSLYRIMLRYYLWMTKFSRKGQWGIIIGLWVGFEVLKGVKEAYPQLAPFIYPLLIAYGVFVLATWVTQPVFDLTLLANPFGRYLLNGVQRAMAVAVGVLLLGALVLVPAGWLLEMWVMLGIGVMMAVLTLPTVATGRCRIGRQMWLMGLYTAVMAVVGVAGVVMMEMDDERGPTFFMAACVGCMLSSIVSNVLSGMVEKK